MVSKDFQGPVRNGGVGTAFFELAKHYQKLGNEVECLLTCQEEYIEGKGFDYWVIEYLKYGLHLVLLERHFPATLLDSHIFHSRELNISYRSSLYCKVSEPEYVFFGDYGGEGFYINKTFGRGYKTISVMHGTSYWGRLENSESINGHTDLTLFDVEMDSVKFADLSIFPSQYIYNWHKKYFDGDLPNRKFICNIYTPNAELLKLNKPIKSIKSIVFFGRLEFRKGFDIFIKLCQKLKSEHPDLKFFALGKLGAYSGGSILNYLNQHAPSIASTVEVLNGMSSSEAIKFIKNNSGLVVFPSRSDNCPMTILECISNGIPIAVSSTGGQSELIAPKFHGSHVFSPSVGDAYLKIKNLINLKSNCVPAESDFSKNAKMALDNKLLLSIKNKKYINKLKNKNPIAVSVVIPTINKKKMELTRLLKLIYSSTRDNYKLAEVIVVNDGGDSFDNEQLVEFDLMGVVHVDSVNQYPGAARNLGVTYASGDYLIFLDDDNIPSLDMIDLYAKRLTESNADIISSWFYVEDKEKGLTYIQTTPGLSGFSDIYENKICDNNMLISATVFQECGGYKAHWGVGFEDYALLLRAIRLGAKVEIIDKPLFTYSQSSTGVNNSSNLMGGFFSVVEELSGDKNISPLLYSIAADIVNVKNNQASKIETIYPSMSEGISALPAQLDIWSLSPLFLRHSDMHQDLYDSAISRHIFGNKISVSKFKLGLLAALQSRIFKENKSKLSPLETIYKANAVLCSIYNKIEVNSTININVDGGKEIEIVNKLLNLIMVGAYVDASRSLNDLIYISDAYYLQNYPDIKLAVDDGHFKNGFEHYLKVWSSESWRHYKYASIIYLGLSIVNRENKKKF